MKVLAPLLALTFRKNRPLHRHLRRCVPWASPPSRRAGSPRRNASTLDGRRSVCSASGQGRALLGDCWFHRFRGIHREGRLRARCCSSRRRPQIVIKAKSVREKCKSNGQSLIIQQSPGRPVALTTLFQKLGLIANCGISQTLVVPFNLEQRHTCFRLQASLRLPPTWYRL